MKFHLTVPNNHQVTALRQPWQDAIGGREIGEIAALADELGFAGLTVGEHFAVPGEHVQASGAHYLHSTTALAYLAGHTKQIRVMANAAVVPLQHPVVQAKQWAVLDWVSGGRAEIVVGAGWMESEFTALGVDFATRGRRLDEYIAAMREIWTEDRASFSGEFVEFADLAARPKPVAPGGVPLWFAGDGAAAVRRVAKWGVGWSPFLTPPQQIPERLDRITGHRDYGGQQVGVFFNLANLRLGPEHTSRHTDERLDAWDSDYLIDQIGWVADLGVTDVAPPLPRLASLSEYCDRLRWLAAEVLPHFA